MILALAILPPEKGFLVSTEYESGWASYSRSVHDGKSGPAGIRTSVST
jgi:hypothetical protein